MSSVLPTVNSSTHPSPINLWDYISTNSAVLQPPVNNKMLYSTGCEFQLMIVGGSNCRSDYHINSSEEWFYQLTGDLILRIIENNQFKSILIRAGSAYLLPANIPHSPQRTTNSIGLVLEMDRPKTAELDQLRWYCSQCKSPLNTVKFHCEDLAKQIESLLTEYNNTESIRTCKQCKYINTVPEPYIIENNPTDINSNNDSNNNTDNNNNSPLVSITGTVSTIDPQSNQYPIINNITHPLPYDILSYINQYRHLLAPPVNNKMIHSDNSFFKIMIVGGPNIRSDYHINCGEEWFYMIEGSMVLKIIDNGIFTDIHIKQGESYLLQSNIPHSPQRSSNTIGIVIERDRSINEFDRLRWYCSNDNCRSELHTFIFKCADLGSQIKQYITEWYSNTPEAIKRRTCTICNTVETKPTEMSKLLHTNNAELISANNNSITTATV